MDFLTGLILPLYNFDKYKSACTHQNYECSVLYKNTKSINPLISRVKAVCEGVFFARDLTNEPSNRLNTNPTTYPDYVSDTTNEGTTSAASYLTRPVVLDNTSTALDIRLTQAVRDSSEVEVYYRTTVYNE